MAGTAEVLQEYLIKLGYQTDAISLRRFEDQLGNTSKKVAKIGFATAGAIVAVEAAVANYAYAMRKTYFDSKLANTSIQNMKAMEFAGKQLGISAETMGSMIKGMSDIIARNPEGMIAYANALGIKVDPNNIGKVALDLIKALDKMPTQQAIPIAEMFGLDSETYRLMRGNADGMSEAMEKYLDIQRRFGIDAEKNSKIALKYAEIMDTFKITLQGVSEVWLSSMLPVFKAVGDFVNGPMAAYMKFMASGGLGAKIYDMLHGGEVIEKGSRLDKLLNGSKDNRTSSDTIKGAQPSTGQGQAFAPIRSKADAVIAMLQERGLTKEQAAGVAANLQRESGFNSKAVGDNGQAYGIAQWHKDRQADFKAWAGKDIQDSTFKEQLDFVMYELREGKWKGAGKKLSQAKTAEEAARIVSEYYERPADAEGESNLRATLASKLYRGVGGGASVVNNNTYNITSSDPKGVAREVSGLQERTYANTMRQLSGVAGPT